MTILYALLVLLHNMLVITITTQCDFTIKFFSWDNLSSPKLYLKINGYIVLIRELCDSICHFYLDGVLLYESLLHLRSPVNWFAWVCYKCTKPQRFLLWNLLRVSYPKGEYIFVKLMAVLVLILHWCTCTLKYTVRFGSPSNWSNDRAFTLLSNTYNFIKPLSLIEGCFSIGGSFTFQHRHSNNYLAKPLNDYI